MLTATPSQTEQDVFKPSAFDPPPLSQPPFLGFLPSRKHDPDMQVLYATQGLYLFLRYFHSIYQRLEIAKNLSYTFDTNLKTDSNFHKHYRS